MRYPILPEPLWPAVSRAGDSSGPDTGARRGATSCRLGDHYRARRSGSHPGYDQIPDPTAQPLRLWAERALPGTRFRNCGVNGQRTDEIAARLGRCAEGADVLIVQGGVNDIAQGLPVEGAAENLRAMVRRGKELGLRVAIVELLPWNGGYRLPTDDPCLNDASPRGLKGKVQVIEW